MTWEEAIEKLGWGWNATVIGQCSDSNPDPAHRDGMRRHVIELASGQVPSYPPVATQLGNAVGAAARFVASGCATAGAEEYERRKAICEACEHFDAGPQRCRQCGCAVAVKAWSKAERCPVGKW